MKKILVIVLLSSSLQSIAQQVTMLNKAYNCSIRGLSVVNDRIIWASGSNGSIARSVDGGKTFAWSTVAGMEKRDFRDIHAFDDRTALIIAVAEPAVILKTSDGGASWKTVYFNDKPGMFLDAMDFRNSQSGVVIGDPINGQMFLAETSDGGEHWTERSVPSLKVQSGEACFASSGTNIIARPGGDFFLVTGGMASRFITASRATPLALVQGKESTGSNSIAISGQRNNKKTTLVAVGGDFAADSSSEKTVLLSKDGGATWTAPSLPPKGYKSCVVFLTPTRLVTCGTSGIDISEDGGRTWKHISDESFHVVQRARKGNSVILAGGKGRIARLDF